MARDFQAGRPAEAEEAPRALAAALGRCARFGVRPGLGAIRAVCSAMGNPQDLPRVVHVAGTNGKGAVCALVDAALRAAGYRTGRYTSPHLVSLNERFSIDGAPAPSAAIDEAFSAVPGADTLTYFELLTATAFELYRRERVEFLVLETGLGGRLDATNVVARPELAAITRIGLDHCDWLGGTVSEIAAEKGGIIKPGVPCVLGAMPAEARRVLESIARERGARAVLAPPEDSPSPALASALGGLSLGGHFNRENAATAYAALRELGVGDEAIARGFASAVWPGRFQRVESGSRRFLVDGAHNPPAMRALVDSLARERGAGAAAFRLSGVAVCGFCGDKDVLSSLRILREAASVGFAVPIRNPRSLPPERTAELMREAGFAEARAFPGIGEALSAAPDGSLVCGSLFLAGEALESLGCAAHPAAFVPNERIAFDRASFHRRNMV